MGCSWDDKDRTRRRFAVVNWHQATATNLVRVRSLWSNRNTVQYRLVTVRVLITITITIKARGATKSATAEQLTHGVLVERQRSNATEIMSLLLSTKQQQQTISDVFDRCGPIETPCSISSKLAAYVVCTWP